MCNKSVCVWVLDTFVCVREWKSVCYIYTLLFMLSRLFHRPDEVHIHRLPNTLSCQHWWSVLLPAPVWDFFTKKGNGKLVAAWGREGGLTGGGSGREKSVGEREKREGGCSHLELLHGTPLWGAPHTDPRGFIGRRRWQKAGRVTGGDTAIMWCMFSTGPTLPAIIVRGQTWVLSLTLSFKFCPTFRHRCHLQPSEKVWPFAWF